MTLKSALGFLHLNPILFHTQGSYGAQIPGVRAEEGEVKGVAQLISDQKVPKGPSLGLKPQILPFLKPQVQLCCPVVVRLMRRVDMDVKGPRSVTMVKGPLVPPMTTHKPDHFELRKTQVGKYFLEKLFNNYEHYNLLPLMLT